LAWAGVEAHLWRWQTGAAADGRNPVGVDKDRWMMTQGRRWGANLGLWAKIPLGFEGSAVA